MCQNFSAGGTGVAVEVHSFEFLSGRLHLDQMNVDIIEENAGDT